MYKQAGLWAAVFFVVLTGLPWVGHAETLAGRVDKVNVAMGEIEIDGVRYKLRRTARAAAGSGSPLSQFQPGDGVLFTPGPGQTLLKIEKPAGGVDLPGGRRGGL